MSPYHQQQIQRFLHAAVLGNSMQSYLAAMGTFLGVLAAAYAARQVLVARLKVLADKTESRLDDLIVDVLRQIRHFELFLLAFWLASRGLAIHASLGKVLSIVFVCAATHRAIKALQMLCGYAVRSYSQEKLSDDATARSAMENLQWIVNGALWVGGALFVLDNLGINVTAAVAGLGIGGVAIALASQAILGDLFSSFTIYMDQPFKVGDFIVVGDMMGTVEHIGVKTTRVRSIGGEMLVFPNSDLTGSRIRNYKHMRERRVVFGFGVPSDTPVEKVRAIPGMVGAILASLDKVRLDRAHFLKIGPSSLEFEVVYFVLSGDYGLYMDRQQSINLGLLAALQKEGVGLALPAQTVHLADARRPP